MTTPPTSQTNPLDPVFSGIPVVFPQTGMINPTWNKWFVDLRAKVNVINQTLASWAGISPGNVTAGTYGDTTHYPIVTVNNFGVVTGISEQSFTSGGGNPIYVNTVTGSYTVVSSDVPAASSYRGMIINNSTSVNNVTIDSFSNTAIPVGAQLFILQNGSGTTTINSANTVSLVGPSITGGGQNSMGMAVQIQKDLWAISGNLSWISGAHDPYWSNVAFLLHGNGTNGSTTISDQKGGAWTAVGNCKISTAQSKFNGSSIFFDGTNSEITTPNNSSYHSSGDFTLEGWVYLNSTSGQTVFGIEGDSTYGSYFEVRIDINSVSGKCAALIETSSGSWTYSSGGTSLTTGNWIFIAVVKYSGTVTYYVNGSSIFSFASAAPVTNFGQTQIGTLSPFSTPQWFSGYLAELRYTVGVARYTANFTPPTTPFPNS